MNVSVLLENTTCREDLRAEHGLSLYLETGDRKLLFDSGQSDAFAENAEKMGVDLSQVDGVILSHGHYDHGGGLLKFLEINSKANIYVNQNVFRPYYDVKDKYVGLDPALEHCDRVRRVGDRLSLGKGLTLLTCREQPLREPVRSYGLTVRENGQILPDDFRHEQYLLVEEGEKRILISGCSHRGILNIQSWFQPDVLIGGFHFKDVDLETDSAYLDRAARTLLEGHTRYYTGHCTGLPQYAFLKERMGDRLHRITTGLRFTV